MHRRPFVIEVAIKAKSKADQDKLGVALAALEAKDEAFRSAADPQSGQTILKGVSEEQLGAAIDLLRRAHEVDFHVGAPQVAYRETLTKRVEINYTHTKRTGGGGEFAKVALAFEPSQPSVGFSFESKIVGGAVPAEYVPSVEKGIASAMESGILLGFPVVDIRTTLIDGAYHDVDSSAPAFEIASHSACREALRRGGSILLEPIMKVEIVTPEEYAGFVKRDLLSRRGEALKEDRRANGVVITTIAPLANMFGYVDNLRQATRGRGSFTMQYSHYARMPSSGDDEPFPPAIGMRE
jgi:elongation factor G